MSSGTPQRPSGIDRVMRSFSAASSVLPYAVSIQPGPSTLTRMWGATDCASARLKEYTPPFAAQKTSPYPPFIPVSTWSHDMLRITLPGGWVRISSTAFQEASTVPRRSTASSRSSFSTQDGPSRRPPPLPREDVGARIVHPHVHPAERAAHTSHERLQVPRLGDVGVQGLGAAPLRANGLRSEEHTSELQSPCNLVCRLLLEKKKKNKQLRYCQL